MSEELYILRAVSVAKEADRWLPRLPRALIDVCASINHPMVWQHDTRLHASACFAMTHWGLSLTDSRAVATGRALAYPTSRTCRARYRTGLWEVRNSLQWE